MKLLMVFALILMLLLGFYIGKSQNKNEQIIPLEKLQVIPGDSIEVYLTIYREKKFFNDTAIYYHHRE